MKKVTYYLQLSSILFLLFSCSNDNPGEQEERRTYVPDDNFELSLIKLGYDDNLDDYVITSNIESVTELNIGYDSLEGQEINIMTGIEDFTSLEYLNLYNHNLTVIDLSSNLNLWELNLVNNNINAIDLSKNLNLALIGLDGNNLSEINLSSNPKLTGISIESNNLTSIDLSNNRQLQEIDLSGNKLATLDLSGFEDLFMIWANDNNLESLNISNTPHIMEIYVKNNNFQCILVDESQVNGGNISIFVKDEGVILSTDCSS